MQNLIGGAGGNARAYRGNTSWAARSASGGTGNNGGLGKQTASKQTEGGNLATANGTNGTGGLLIIYADHLNNNGEITANGVAANTYGVARWFFSDGGSLNIFANAINGKEKMTANGGQISETNLRGKGRRWFCYNKSIRARFTL